MVKFSPELYKKLGLSPNIKAYTLYAPANYVKSLATPIPLENIKDIPLDCDWIQVFYKNSELLKDQVGPIKNRLSKTGQLWIAWPKKSSVVISDLNDNLAIAAGLKAGLVDIKVVSINDAWSGLKFVYRLKDRED